jgi:pyruvate formate lyase activating enzyme
MIETAKIAKSEDLKNVVVSNGYINPEPLRELCLYIDAFNIDLKAFNNEFYKTYTNSSLDPVLETIYEIKKNQCHLEITNLIIPELNDDPSVFEDMVKTLANETGKDTVLHLSRYHPAYKLRIEGTGRSKMSEFYGIAKKHLDFVYLGNILTEEGQNTFCPNCGQSVVSRDRYYTKVTGLNKDHCLYCHHKIPIYI